MISTQDFKLEEISLKRRVLNSVFWLATTKTVGQALSWVITIYVARILTPEDYGLMGIPMVFIGFIRFFNEFGLGTVIIQKNISKDDLSNMFLAIICTNILLTLISFFLSHQTAIFFNEPRLKG